MFVLSPQLHLKLFEGDLMEHIVTPTGLAGHWAGPQLVAWGPDAAPGGPSSFSRAPGLSTLPLPPPRLCFLECSSTGVPIPAAGPHPLHPKGWTCPRNSAHGSCGPEQLAASLPHLCTRPLERRNTTKGGWAVTSGQWDLGWGAPQEGRRGGADRQRAKCNFRQNHSPTGGSLG